MNSSALMTVSSQGGRSGTELFVEQSLPEKPRPTPAEILEDNLDKTSNVIKNQDVVSLPLGDAANARPFAVSTSTRGPTLISQLQSKRVGTRVLFVARQEWQGVVVEVNDDWFYARLTDLTRSGAEAEEEAEFPLGEVSEDDRELLQPGAVFRWAIGYQIMPGGTKQRISQIVFRRLPLWTARDLREADALAASLADYHSRPDVE